MCGIFGILKNHNFRLASHEVQNITNLLKSRGPDQQDHIDTDQFALISTRLSHNDLSTKASQPFQDVESKFVISFNGEIINFLELRDELVSLGVVFKTRSDTEVILQGYKRFGTNFFSKLRGMFAFIIWDPNIQSFIIARDWFGIKPLHFTKTNKAWFFSSTIRPLGVFEKLQANRSRYFEYLTFGHVARPNTLFKDIFSFETGKFAIVGQHTKEMVYQDIPITSSNAELNELIARNIKGHLHTDREIGIQLSGGIDSSFVMFEALKYKASVRSFSVDVPDKENSELIFQKQVLDKTKSINTMIEANADLFFNHFDKTTINLELPIHHLANIFLDILFENAAKDVQALLTGEGGDELFLGYKRYFFDQTLVDKIFSDDGNPRNRMNKLFPLMRQVYVHPERMKQISPDLTELFPERLNLLFANDSDQFLDSLVKHDHNYGLDSLLIRQDRLGMAYGLENRPPLLCPDLLRMNQELIAQKNIGKIYLKKNLENVLGDKFVNRKKKGFGLPIATWMRTKNADELFHNLEIDWVDKSELERELSQLRGSDNESSKYLMRIYALAKWEELLIKDNSSK